MIYGGTQLGHSIHQVMQGCNILCATPGRLLDIIRREKVRSLNLSLSFLHTGFHSSDLIEPKLEL